MNRVWAAELLPARPAGELEDRSAIAGRLIEAARSEGIALTGAGGLLSNVLRQVPAGSTDSAPRYHLYM